MAAIFGEGKIFENCKEYTPWIPCGLKIATKSLYLAQLRRSKEICVLHFWENFLKITKSTKDLCFAFLAKILKFKMAAIFEEGKIFGKLQRLHSLERSG